MSSWDQYRTRDHHNKWKDLFDVKARVNAGTSHALQMWLSEFVTRVGGAEKSAALLKGAGVVIRDEDDDDDDDHHDGGRTTKKKIRKSHGNKEEDVEKEKKEKEDSDVDDVGPRGTSDDGMAACLLQNTDNYWLPEWLAYHWLILPLRYLVVGVDPRTKASLLEILQRWNGSSSDDDDGRMKMMDILVWHDYDYGCQIDLSQYDVIKRHQL